jgi:hypothetical protein
MIPIHIHIYKKSRSLDFIDKNISLVSFILCILPLIELVVMYLPTNIVDKVSSIKPRSFSCTYIFITPTANRYLKNDDFQFSQ